MKAFITKITLCFLTLTIGVTGALQAHSGEERETVSKRTATAFNVTGGGQLCAASGVSIGLDGSEFGMAYLLKIDGVVDNDSRQMGTGLALTWNNITADGDYKVIARESGASDVEMTGEVTVSTGPQLAPPTWEANVPLRRDTNTLYPTMLKLWASVSGATSYDWFDENGFIETTDTLKIANYGIGTPRTDYFRVRGAIGACKGDFTTFVMGVTQAPNPDSITKSTSCGTLYLSASGTPDTDVKWYWQGTDSLGTSFSMDAETYDLRVTTAGKYYLKAYDEDNEIWSPDPLRTDVTTADLPSGAVTPGGCSTITAIDTLTTPGAHLAGTNYNTLEAYDVFKSGMTDANITATSASTDDVAMTAQYVDGLGRPLQTVSRKASPNSKDMVQAVKYDAFGRQAAQYLPFESTGTNAALKVNPFGEQSTFYDSYQPDEEVTYGLTEFENSPLNRVKLAMAPGDAWAGSRVGVSTNYLLNTAEDDVRIWRLDDNGVPESEELDVYAPRSLSLVLTTDEEGHKVKQFTDKMGRVILKQVQETDTLQTGYSDWLNTYYVYDDYNNLRFVLPPKAVDLLDAADWSWNSSQMDDLVFKYSYDTRGRMSSKQVPGADTVFMVYDQLDRLVLTQDGNQRALSTDQWTFTKYDELGRPAMTGFLNSNLSQDSLQSISDAWERTLG